MTNKTSTERGLRASDIWFFILFIQQISSECPLVVHTMLGSGNIAANKTHHPWPWSSRYHVTRASVGVHLVRWQP